MIDLGLKYDTWLGTQPRTKPDSKTLLKTPPRHFSRELTRYTTQDLTSNSDQRLDTQIENWPWPDLRPNCQITIQPQFMIWDRIFKLGSNCDTWTGIRFFNWHPTSTIYLGTQLNADLGSDLECRFKIRLWYPNQNTTPTSKLGSHFDSLLRIRLSNQDLTPTLNLGTDFQIKTRL